MDLINYSESLKIIRSLAESLRPAKETLPVREARDRVVASPIHALTSNPNLPLAAMDGIAVNTFSVPDALVRLRKDQWAHINTGEPLPSQFNSVVKIEDVNWENGIPVLMKKPDLYQNVRRVGEDFAEGTLLFVQGHRLQSQDLSLLLTSGIIHVDVFTRPLVSFIPTGSELTMNVKETGDGKILESNSAMVAGLVEAWGGQFRLQDPVPDDKDDLAQMIRFCSTNSNIIVVSAGTSKGTRDLTEEVIGLLGKIHFHGVRINPAKPVLLGEIDGLPVLGLPGYPVSAYLASYLYLRYLVCALSQVRWQLNQAMLISADEIPKRDVDAFYRVNTFEVDDRIYVRRVAGGAGSVFSLSQLDGWMHVPPDIEIKKRDGVRIDVIRDRSGNTLVARGAADATLMRLFDLFRPEMPEYRLLFWTAQFEDAFQSVVERNAHFATINVPVDGPDPFPIFARRIQEEMYRYRVCTRSMRLLFAKPPAADHPSQLPKDLRVAIPAGNADLWQHFSAENKVNVPSFRISTVHCEESGMLEPLKSGRWDAVFCDIRFLTDDFPTLGEAREHIDLLIPESYIELPAVKKLIEILASDRFAAGVQGCDLSTRGPVRA